MADRSAQTLASSPARPSRRSLQHWVHWALLSGVAASALLLSFGIVGVLVSGRPRTVGTPPPLPAVLRGVACGQGVDLLYLGLLVLMATPVLRVAVLAVG